MPNFDIPRTIELTTLVTNPEGKKEPVKARLADEQPDGIFMYEISTLKNHKIGTITFSDHLISLAISVPKDERKRFLYVEWIKNLTDETGPQYKHVMAAALEVAIRICPNDKTLILEPRNHTLAHVYLRDDFRSYDPDNKKIFPWMLLNSTVWKNQKIGYRAFSEYIKEKNLPLLKNDPNDIYAKFYKAHPECPAAAYNDVLSFYAEKYKEYWSSPNKTKEEDELWLLFGMFLMNDTKLMVLPEKTLREKQQQFTKETLLLKTNAKVSAESLFKPGATSETSPTITPPEDIPEKKP